MTKNMESCEFVMILLFPKYSVVTRVVLRPPQVSVIAPHPKDCQICWMRAAYDYFMWRADGVGKELRQQFYANFNYFCHSLVTTLNISNIFLVCFQCTHCQ